MKVTRKCLYLLLLLWSFQLAGQAQTVAHRDLKPDRQRAFAVGEMRFDKNGRKGGYVSAQAERSLGLRPTAGAVNDGPGRRAPAVHSLPRPLSKLTNEITGASINAGTPLSRVLHTSQFSLVSAAGTDEQFVDRTGDLVADQRTSFDNDGGSFDIAVGQSGARYEVYSAVFHGRNIGVLVVAVDTNGNYVADAASTYDLEVDFALPSAASVVTGTAKSGREFVIVSSSGYYNSADPNDPNNELSPGVVLLVRDANTGGFDNSRSRTLVRVGDDRLYNANALALLPNNDLLIADFHSNELRIVRDTDGDGLPDTLDPQPYYSYRYTDDAPLEVAVNSRGVVFSHSADNDTVLLAIYDDNGDGRGDADEVVVTGLSIDNNLFLHGLTVDRVGNVYVIEDATGLADGPGGNDGTPLVDAFPDPGLDGFLQNGAVFTTAADPNTEALSGISFGALPANPINDSRAFVRQQYLDFLDREPDTAGWNYWTNQIAMCGNNDVCIKARRLSVSAAFFIELEFQESGSFVYRFYRASYGRQPVFAEFGADRSRVVGGTNLEANKQAFATDWVNRQTFRQAYPVAMTAGQFVNKLFDTAGLVPYTAQRQKLINDLQNGRTRAQVLRDVTELTDFKTREYNPSFVLMQYFGYLQRDADQGGYVFWLNVLNNRARDNYQGMVCAFITSTEYQERFGLLLRRTNVDCQP